MRAGPITGLDRLGKHLWVQIGSIAWHVHLSSTGWFLPSNEAAFEATATDPIHANFLHSVNDENVRLRIHLDDGQIWNYHDPRTWGKWWLKPYKALLDDPYMQGLGPDWLKEPARAKEKLQGAGSKRPLKEVLCDQTITAGLGNYLACEVAHRARIHPHTGFALLRPIQRTILNDEIEEFVALCMKSGDHSHWAVFDKLGEGCKNCGTPIAYAKDGSGKRGSYYCPICQLEQRR